jgi:hypothetical protein
MPLRSKTIERPLPLLIVRKLPFRSRPFPAIHRITLNVGSWRDADLLDNIQKFRLSGPCGPDMLAASSSLCDP